MARTASDIPKGNWIDRRAPLKLRPYLRLARLDRPIGTWLLLLPCWWGISLASNGWPNPWLMVLFAIGAIVMRGAGCTLNDIVDRDIDARVARTADRPIPSGAVSVLQAEMFFALQCLIGLSVLMQFNGFAIGVGIASLSLIVIYPFMKRITDWPQVVLGLAFNWGALLGWSAVRGDLEAAPITLYVGGVFWTLAYDTIYAHQDKHDDLQVGVRSTALRLGAATRPWLFVFHALALVCIATSAMLAGVGAGAGSWLLLVALLLAAAHAIWQAGTVDLDDPVDCLAKFKSNRDLGLLVLIGLVLARGGSWG